tara:strand:+ start:110 stop:1678 length:1569 start_codon:yes stop_codon:yes gene_type:complete
MKLFSQLIINCINEPKTLKKIQLIERYLQDETKKNIPIAFHLLIGEHFGRFCSGTLLRQWCSQLLNYPQWLIDESYQHLGDNSETIALCFSNKSTSKTIPLHQLYTQMVALKKAPLDEKKNWVISCWQQLSSDNIYTFNKLLGGGLRIGASKKNVIKALSNIYNIHCDILQQRIISQWEPTAKSYNHLIDASSTLENHSCPFPFYLASPVDKPLPEQFEQLSDWFIEPKWDGIRAQLIHQPTQTALWSRGNELISLQFPELIKAAHKLPYGIYDGEILAWINNTPLPFYDLQKRLNRKTITQKLLNLIPCVMIFYDCLKLNQQDIRNQPLQQRRKHICNVSYPFLTSQTLTLTTYKDITTFVAQARQKNIEGVMIKQKNSTYKIGRKRGDWWKLKVNPLTLDTVIMYAQQGKGIRSGLYTDYTFGVWNNTKLVPIGKAYSGLTNEEIKTINKIIKQNLTDKFGPVRAVKPCIVLEIAFDAIHPSSRHKSGLALRFPRIARLRLDKPIDQANTLKDAQQLCNI